MFKGAWVYILRCNDDSYYTGCTTALDKRMEEHELGIHPGYTAARRPVELVWFAEFPDIFQAIDIERQIKGWSRKKKEALMRDDFELLHQLAECTNDSHYRLKKPEKVSSLDFVHSLIALSVARLSCRATRKNYRHSERSRGMYFAGTVFDYAQTDEVSFCRRVVTSSASRSSAARRSTS